MTGMIEGGVFEDIRGTMRYCNDFDMLPVKRFYTISNSYEKPVRGWIGHKKETKWFLPTRGMTTVCVKPMDGMSTSESFLLDSRNPHVLKIEPNHWFCVKQGRNSEVLVFSNCKVGEFANDDFRSPYEET